ncbi:MAG: aspartate aminotransferase family protein [Cohaesibacteraceae bacterium]|nr:aspartate aminotransferase family protein [Cohaesibacteraceae bacterium]MBL4875852.1 aspartate aminotransferase family protein [Cohaesibacteraceae bacterium]
MSAVLHRSFKNRLPMVERGQGVYLYDIHGKQYLDASGGAAVSCLGHDHPLVLNRIREQLDKVSFAHSSFFSNQPSEALAEKLVSLAPKGFGRGSVAFLSSGSEAMEAALKLARQYHVENGEPDRVKFISRKMSYHGNTLGALAIGAHPQRKEIYHPLLMDVTHISSCYPYREQLSNESEIQYADRLSLELERAILDLDFNTVAALVIEPVSGASLGCVTPVAGYLKSIRAICKRYGVLLIADEVMCGLGRTGTMFALEQEEISADIITIAKGLGAGYQPISGIMAAENVVDCILAGSATLAHGHTYMSHAIACAGACAVIEAIETQDLLANVHRQGAALALQLNERFSNHPNVGEIRGRGLFQAIELVQCRETKKPFARSGNLTTKIRTTARDNGLICYPSAGCADGINGDHVLLAPPYIVDQSHIDEICEKLEQTLNSCLAA